ncbi:MAG: hypothetical protein KDA41_12330, partial [Planctomycetales bacterium]|nr:hypothetical protein [Planctomycetales bacterium]
DRAAVQQPVANEDETVWVVLDGAICNVAPLRQRLEGSGHKFKTASGAETVAHLYEDQGPDGLAHLVGEFALAVWDAPRRRLTLARDRLGVRPLVYRQEAGRLLFASSLKSMLHAPGAVRQLDRGSLHEFLTYGFVPHPNTILQGVRKLPPAHYAVFQDEQLDVRPYWTCDLARQSQEPAARQAQRLAEAIDEAVAARMAIAPAPGVWLGGDAASAVVAALAQKHSERPLKSFSFAAGPAAAQAQADAYTLGFEHRAIALGEPSPEALAAWAQQLDEPLVDDLGLPWILAAGQTAPDATLLLSAAGGAELFGLRRRHQRMRRAAALAGWPDPFAWASGAGKRLPPVDRHLLSICLFGEADRAQLYSDEALAALSDCDPAGFVRRAWKRSGARDWASAAMNTDLTTLLSCRLLASVAAATAAYGASISCPLLDERVVELAAPLPARERVGWFGGGRVLHKAFDKLLPRRLWKRRTAVRPRPAPGALASLADDVLRDARTAARGLFQPAAIDRLLQAARSGRHNRQKQIGALVALELWLRRWMD